MIRHVSFSLFDFTLSYHVIGVDDFLDVYALDLM